MILLQTVVYTMYSTKNIIFRYLYISVIICKFNVSSINKLIIISEEYHLLIRYLPRKEAEII